MSFSKESRFRNVVSAPEFNARGAQAMPQPLVLGCVAAILLVCCTCIGFTLGLQISGGGTQLGRAFESATARTTATPTPLSKTATVPLKTKGTMDNGLEMTVISVQRPLKVEGGVKLPADQQFILVTVQIANTKKTGAAIKVGAPDFSAKGDGGLSYETNPKTVTIPNMLSELSLDPGKSKEVELIYQIAADDSGLKL